MRLQNLSMYRWGNDPMKGSLVFSDDAQNEIKLQLSEDKCNQILTIVAQQLVDVSREQAAALTANIIEDTGRRVLE